MKNIFKYLSCAFVLTSALSACSAEDYGHLSADGTPLIANYENAFSVSVDQTTNYATFNFLFNSCNFSVQLFYTFCSKRGQTKTTKIVFKSN